MTDLIKALEKILELKFKNSPTYKHLSLTNSNSKERISKKWKGKTADFIYLQSPNKELNEDNPWASEGSFPGAVLQSRVFN